MTPNFAGSKQAKMPPLNTTKQARPNVYHKPQGGQDVLEGPIQGTPTTARM